MPQYRIDDEHAYDVDLGGFRNDELSALTRALGCGIVEFKKRWDDMDPDAIQAFIWVLRRRTEPKVRLDDVTFTLNEFNANLIISDEEYRASWVRLGEDDREALLASMPSETRGRLFDENGELVPEDAPAPLAPDELVATES